MERDDRFWAKVRMPTNRAEGCCEWQGTRDRKGYGRLTREGRSLYAHRHAWSLANGPIPEGSLILHKCDNPSCVCPDHLYVGNHIRNMRDAVERGRTAKGKMHGLSKLTDGDVRMARESEESTTALARELGVNPATLSRARRGLTWKHLEEGRP